MTSRINMINKFELHNNITNKHVLAAYIFRSYDTITTTQYMVFYYTQSTSAKTEKAYF